MATKIITKNSSTTTAIPTAGDLVQGELAVNVTDKRLFTENAAGAIVELGTSPSTIDINAGTIDGTVIGGTTAAAGSFTTLSTTGAATFSGDVGVGNSSPTADMLGANGGLVIGNGTGAKGLMLFGSATSQQNIAFSDTSASQQGLIQYDHGGDYMRFFTNSLERFRIDSAGAATFSGNVGLGTSPLAKLHLYTVGLADGILVEGNDNNNVKLRLKNIGAGGEEWQIQTGQQGASNSGFHIRSNTSGVNALSLYSTGAAIFSGNVGIGTSSPNVNLEILSGGTFTGAIRVGDSGSSRRLILEQTDVLTYTIGGTGTSSVTRFVSGGSSGIGTERMRIDASGNLLVGTTAPLLNSKANFVRANTTSSAIVINAHNSAASSTSRATGSIFRGASQGNGADAHLVLTDSIASNYYFGGNNAGAYVIANSNGVRLSNGGTSWASDSDERLKDIIEPIENGLEKVSTLRSVIGKYKTDEEDKRRVFLIAQDVQAVLPEAVFENEGNLMLQYTDLIPLCIKAIQEQTALIEALTARLEALEGA